ncbi:MAG: PH domain-containing protein [Chloroflexota bacterium]
MDERYLFGPERGRGRAFHLVLLVAAALAALGGVWQAAQASLGPVFLAYLLPGLAALGLLPLLGYRLYGLQNSGYVLEREGMRLRWGLRVEEIPVSEILWVRRAAELGRTLPLPRLHWPGAVVGTRHWPGAGEVEYMAATTRDLVVIATPGKGYVVSPSDVDGFLLAFQRCTEMGSLLPIAPRSEHSTLLLAAVWRSRPARSLLLGGAALSLALLVWVSLAAPTRSTVALGFQPTGGPGDAAPALRLLLLPVINTIFFLIDLFLGLFLYRRPEGRLYALLVWAAGALTALLFLAAVLFILLAG